MKRILILAAALFLSLGAASYGDGLLAPCAGVFCNGPFTLSANLPVIGNGSGQPTTGTRSGSTTVFGTTSGTLINGHCVSIDGSGNLVDAGGACTTGGGGGTVSSGTINQLGVYAATGTVISGLATANSGVLVTSGAGVPSISSTLPNGLALGTPGSVTLTNATGLPISGITGLGTGVATLLGGTSSGTGGPAGTLSPTFTTPVIGVATATSINKVAITAPAASATLTIANTKTLTVSNTLTFAGTDTSTLNIGAGGTLATGAFTATGTSGATIPLLNGANTWSGVQSFTDGDLSLLGSSSGNSIIKAPATGGGTATLPSGSGTLAYTGSFAPAALTSAHLFVGNVSNVATDVALTGDASISNTGVWTNTAAAGNFAVGGNFVVTGTSAPTLSNGTVGIYSAGTGSGAIFTGQGSSSDVGFFNAAQSGGFQVSHAGLITLFGVTTGTNADFLCFSAGHVIQLQASACTISSLRFKKNVQAFTGNALSSIGILAVDTFYYRAKNEDVNGNAKQLGLIAENVAKIAPICAEYEPDGKTPKSYKQECLIGLLVKGVQEQQIQIANDNARIIELAKEIALLKRGHK